MSSETLQEIAWRLADYSIVARVEFLRTKVRAHLTAGGYVIDIYFNRTLGKYSYTLIKGDKRVIGWDNAPHHLSVRSYPHHFHDVDGTVRSSLLSGDPTKDLSRIMKAVKKFLKS